MTLNAYATLSINAFATTMFHDFMIYELISWVLDMHILINYVCYLNDVAKVLYNTLHNQTSACDIL